MAVAAMPDIMLRSRVYVSGPIIGDGDPAKRAANVQQGIDAGKRLLMLGYAPIIPQLTDYADPDNECGWATWIECDLSLVSACQAVLRLPGYSRGADRECDFANERGIMVFTSIEDLTNFVPRIMVETNTGREL